MAVSAYDIGTIDHELAKNDVHTALSDLRVESYNRLDHVVRQLAPVLGIQGNCSEPYTLPDDPAYHHDPEQLFFALEYTNESLIAGLWKEECGVAQMTTRLNSAQFGHNAMQSCRDDANTRWTCDEKLASALRSVSANPSREDIGAVLVFGEAALDEDTLVVLLQVLDEQFPNGDLVDLSRVQDFSSDLAFAGARAMAKTDWAARSSEGEDHYKQEL